MAGQAGAAGRVLVTGATGFVGRHLVSRLMDERRELTLAVRRASACPPSWSGRSDVRIVETGDIETAQNLGAALRDVSMIVHAAGLAHTPSDGSAGEERHQRANADATARLAAAAAGTGVRLFVNLGSLATVTGNASVEPVTDDSAGGPTTAYGESKRLAERHVLALAERGIVAISLRPPLVVGADAKGNWGALLRLAATGLPLPFASVRNRRSFIGIDTLTRAIAHLCAHEWPVHHSGGYCIADAETVSLAEIVAALRMGMGMPPRLFAFPPAILHGMASLISRRRADALFGDLEVDSSRFHGAFAFRPSQNIAEAIRLSGEGYRRREAARPA